MILTGKSASDFDRWLFYNRFAQRHDTFSFVKHALDGKLLVNLYVEWLDTVGFHVMVEPHIGGGADVYYAKVIYRNKQFIDTWEDIGGGEPQYFTDRFGATTEAIKKANELYNSWPK